MSFLRLLLPILLLSACHRQAANQPVAPPREGIVSMAPNLTETVFALGEGNRVVAVGDYDDYPPEVLQLPRAGGYIDPNLEKITLLKPGLILLPGRHQQVSEYASLNNIPVLNVDMDSFASIEDGILTIGNALHAEEKAQELVGSMRREKEALRAAVAGLSRPRVLIITSRQPRDLNQLYAAGGDAFISEAVALAGGDNLYADSGQRYFEASKETVVLKAPEVILEFHAGSKLSEEEKQALAGDWDAFPSLPAVKDKRIYIITESHGLRPGPRLIEIAWMLARLLHPAATLEAKT